MSLSKIDIKVSLYSYRPFDNIKRGKIQLLLEGNDCYAKFYNAIGRIAVKRLPSYAFAKELIKIDQINPSTGYHDSVHFNHDMLRDHILNTPIYVDPGFAFLHEKYWKNVDYLKPDREIHENEKRVEVFLDVKNSANEGDTQAIYDVTTNDMKIYVDNVLTELYDKNYPYRIVKLNPKEGIKCSMRAVIGVGINHTCWDAASNYYYDQETLAESNEEYVDYDDTPGKVIFTCESAGRFDEFVLIERSLEYFRIRTKLLKDEINRLYLLEQKHTNKFRITIHDEDHTMGEPIAYELQMHPNIIKASNSRPDLLVRTIIIEIIASKKEHMLGAINESFDNLLAKIDKFEQEFKKIEKKPKKAPLISEIIKTNTNSNKDSKKNKHDTKQNDERQTHKSKDIINHQIPEEPSLSKTIESDEDKSNKHKSDKHKTSHKTNHKTSHKTKIRK